MLRIAQIALVVLGVVSALHTALAQTEPAPMSGRAKRHFDRAGAFFEQQNYRAAMHELKAGYAIDPRREFLFPWAQAARLSGDCERAVPLYNKFLATNPSRSQTEAAQNARALCAQALPAPPTPRTERAEPPPSPSDKPSEPGLEPATVVPAAHVSVTDLPAIPRYRPWYTDGLGDVLVGVGIAGVAAGVAFFAMSSSELDEARHAMSSTSYSAAVESAESKRTVSYVALGIGSALVVTGILRYVLRAPVPEVAISVEPARASLAIGGTF